MTSFRSSARLMSSSSSSSMRAYGTVSTSSSPGSSSSQAAPPPPRRKRAPRTLSSRPGADLVGPPDPVSNLRPVIYGSAFTAVEAESSSTQQAASTSNHAPQLARQEVHHPYSTSEFTTTPSASSSLSSSIPSSRSRALRPPSPYYLSLLSRLESLELTHHLLRSRSDKFSQRFWSDNNRRYTAALDAYRKQHQPEGTGTGGDEAVLLAPFYSAWLDANAKRYRAYNERLWRMTRADLGPAIRYEGMRRWVRCVGWWERIKPW